MPVPTKENLQKAFTKVVQHLRQQNCRAMKKWVERDEYGEVTEENEVCAYRGDNGLMCAIGCLIPDDEYKEIFEDRTAHCVSEEVSTLYGLPSHFLNDLQHIHDKKEISSWEEEFQAFAETWQLEMPSVD